MNPPPGHLHAVGAIRAKHGPGAILTIERTALLVEIGCHQAEPFTHPAIVRFRPAQQCLDQRGFADTIAADDPDPVALADDAVEMVDQHPPLIGGNLCAGGWPCRYRNRQVDGLQHHLPAALNRGGFHAGAAAKRGRHAGAFGSHDLQFTHAPLVAFAPCRDAFA